MTYFKFAKKLNTEYLLSKSEGLNSNGTPTQGFIRHLPKKKKIDGYNKIIIIL
jgi:hypothetical protein